MSLATRVNWGLDRKKSETNILNPLLRPGRAVLLSLAATLFGSFSSWPAAQSAAPRASGELARAFAADGPDRQVPLDSPQDAARPATPPARVYKESITPHWFQNGGRFWYRNDLPGGAKEFIVVDAAKGVRQSAFDAVKLAAALSAASGTPHEASRLPFDRIEFVGDGRSIRFQAAQTNWQCDLTSYACEKTATALSAEPGETQDPAGRRRGTRPRPANDESEPQREARSPDGHWTALIKDHNLHLRPAVDGPSTQLSHDGTSELAYRGLIWSPDSKAIVAFRVEPGDRREVHLVESSPKGGGRAQLQSRPYALPGDKFSTYELNLFDPVTGRQLKPEVDRFEHEWLNPRLHWQRDQRHFNYVQTDRGHQRLRVIEVDALGGQVRNVIEEKTSTFLWTVHTESLGLNLVTWLEKTDEILYASERDGWRHLYRLDPRGDGVLHPITSGEWVIRGIDRIDEEQRLIWFHGSGRRPGQDPYLLHYYRVGFDGTGLVALTEGDGQHAVQYSPDRAYLIDTYSRVDLAPRSELRRVSDGRLIVPLEEADLSELRAGDWAAPEVFVAKGRDEKTDIWGIICRPAHFDPSKKYPVIEDIYAGPQSSYVPKSFSPTRRYASLTDLGFIIVKMDGMGTANRSKAFHDVCWKNLKDAGFADRIRWMRSAAARYPALDLTRVGVYGTSAGGQNAAGAVLFHPEFYQVAVAACGCHDNRMDKASWNEQWMGYPVGPHYGECSNIDHADRLRGKLLLIVGEMDNNVPPESTFRFVDALIKADKDFDFLLVPGASHGPGGAYGIRRRDDFFRRHLLGVEPRDRNAPKPPERAR